MFIADFREYSAAVGVLPVVSIVDGIPTVSPAVPGPTSAVFFCPPNCCQCSSYEFLHADTVPDVVSSPSFFMPASPVADFPTDSGGPAAVDIHDDPFVPPAAGHT